MRGAATNHPKFDQYAALAKQGSAFYSRNQGTRYTVLAVIVAFAAVLAGLHFSPETAGVVHLSVDAAIQSAPRPSLFDRLGKLEKIEPLVSTIYQKHKNDPISAKYFEGKDHAKVERLVVEFFAAGTGGPVVYSGRAMDEAHKTMGVTGEAFLAIQDHVMSSMETHG